MITDQRIITMTLQEFNNYKIPTGWKLMYVNGSERRGYPGSLDRYFEMTVTIQRIEGE